MGGAVCKGTSSEASGKQIIQCFLRIFEYYLKNKGILLNTFN